MSDAIKREVLLKVANGKSLLPYGRAKWKIGDKVVHVRFVTSRKPDKTHAYNVNPTTLTADYELWICSNAKTYYLTPMPIISRMYHHPDSYIDGADVNRRIMSVNTTTHLTLYARGGRKEQFAEYFRATL